MFEVEDFWVCVCLEFQTGKKDIVSRFPFVCEQWKNPRGSGGFSTIAILAHA